MTIPATTPKVLYSGDDVTDNFPITFIYWDATDIRAVVNIGGVETLWVLNTHYTLVGGNGATGTLTATTPPATGTTLMIRSNRAAAQEVALPLGGPLPSVDIEQALDKVVRITQQLREEVDRALKLQETSTDDGIAAAAALQESVDNFEANYESTIIAAETATTQAGIATSAANSATASEAAAAISEANASASEDAAGIDAAAASASAAAAAGYLAPVTGTSTSSLLVGTGSKSLTTETGLNFVPGHPIKIARTSDANNTYMVGVVTSYDAGTGAMVAEIGASAGSGTHTDWTVLLTPASSSALASNLAGGSAGTLPYQSDVNTTAMLPAGSAGQVLASGGAGAPVWTSQSSLSVGSATNATNATNVTGTTTAAVPTSALASGTANSSKYLRGDRSWQDFPSVSAFPAGTLMLFQQTAAPTGWTKQTDHNDKALRVVSGTASSGGNVAFSTVFGKTETDAHTLTTAQIPSHAHTGINMRGGGGAMAGGGLIETSASSNSLFSTFTTQAAGSGNSHSHNIDIRVQYVDLIIAAKD